MVSLHAPGERTRGAVADHKDANVKLLSHVREPGQKLSEFLLSFGQLAPAAVVDTEAGHDAVDDEEAVFIALEVGGYGVQ